MSSVLRKEKGRRKGGKKGEVYPSETYYREIIRNKPVSGPLGEKPNRNEDDQPMAISRSFEKLSPIALVEFRLERNGFLYFFKFDVDHFIIQITLSVNICQNLLRLIESALRNQEAG